MNQPLPMTAGHLALYLAVMALVTYLIRAVPFTLFRKEIQSVFFRSFLAYVPYAVLGAMTFPAILSSTSSTLSAVIGLAVAVLCAYLELGLLPVALAACASVFVSEWIITLF